MALDPDLPFARFAPGQLLSRRFFGDIEGAIAKFRAAIALVPDCDEAEWLTMEYEMQGDSASVAGIMDSASIHDPAYRAAFAEGFGWPVCPKINPSGSREWSA